MDETTARIIAEMIRKYLNGEEVDNSIGEKIEAVQNETAKLVTEFDKVIDDAKTLTIISIVNPLLTINVAAITGSLKQLSKLFNDDENFARAYIGLDNELAKKIIEENELCQMRIKVFLEEYNKVANQI